MKILNLLMWVGQFGLSILFPTVFFLLAGVWHIGQLDSDSLRTSGAVFFFPYRKGLSAFPLQSCRGNE